jgi:uncharacterized protein (TIGR02145 family)
MKKLIDYLMIFAALILLGVGCQSEEPVGENENENEDVRTFSLTASIPEESGSASSIPEEFGSARIAFTQGGGKVAPTWETGDQLDLLFVQVVGDNTTKVKQTVTVSNISADGKKADFKFTLPDEIQDGTFDLYGVYGGEGLDIENPSLAKLPMITSTATSLTSLANEELFMMVFSQKGLSTSSPQARVTFRHLGSLFCLTLKNLSGTALTSLGRAELVSSSVSGWAYNSGTTQRYYNLVGDAFQDPETAGSFITLYADGNVDTDGTLSFWGWYPPLPEGNWPELTLELYDKNNTLLGESGNVKPARTSPTSPGMCYHFYAVWNDAGLHFTDDSYTGVFDFDGNYYPTVVIGDQTWMAGNLKTTHYNDGTTIPHVTDNTAWASLTTDAYAWYANDEATYKNAYGALYNWYAVNNTHKLCPTGWHVPSDAEWKILEMELGMSQTEADKTGWRGTNEGSKLAGNAALWNNGTLENDSEFGSSGFTALPGGYRSIQNGTFNSIGYDGYWWSATETNATNAWCRYLLHYHSDVNRISPSKRGGYSVRCLRD